VTDRYAPLGGSPVPPHRDHADREEELEYYPRDIINTNPRSRSCSRSAAVLPDGPTLWAMLQPAALPCCLLLAWLARLQPCTSYIGFGATRDRDSEPGPAPRNRALRTRIAPPSSASVRQSPNSHVASQGCAVCLQRPPGLNHGIRLATHCTATHSRRRGACCDTLVVMTARVLGARLQV
jgi:hypothetical protein